MLKYHYKSLSTPITIDIFVKKCCIILLPLNLFSVLENKTNRVVYPSCLNIFIPYLVKSYYILYINFVLKKHKLQITQLFQWHLNVICVQYCRGYFLMSNCSMLRFVRVSFARVDYETHRFWNGGYRKPTRKYEI